MKLSKSFKKVLIYGLMTVITGTLLIIIKDCFHKKSIKKIQPKIENITSNISILKDSSTQNNIKIKQKNINKENANTHINKIENNGNLNIGQSGGTVNQTIVVTKPLPRHITEKDAQIFRDSIYINYVVDVDYCMTDKECENYANEILNVLYKMGYKTTYSLYGITAPDLEQNYFISVDHKKNTATITVYRLK